MALLTLNPKPMIVSLYFLSIKSISIYITGIYRFSYFNKWILWILFLNLLILPKPLAAQYSLRQYASQCNAAVLPKQRESLFYLDVPSLTSQCDKPLLHLSYFNRYMLSACSEKSAYFIYPNQHLTLGASFLHFGFPIYYEAKSTLNISKSFHKRLFMGINMNYYFSGGSTERRFQTILSYDVAVSFPFAKKFLYSVVVSDLSHAPLLERNSFLPVSLINRLLFKVDKSFNISITSIVSNKYGFFAGIAMYYLPLPSVVVGIGVGGKPFTPGLSSSYRFKDFSVQLAFLYHPVLGISPYSDVVIPF